MQVFNTFIEFFMPKENYISKVPNDILECIFSYCNFTQKQELRLVNKKFYAHLVDVSAKKANKYAIEVLRIMENKINKNVKKFGRYQRFEAETHSKWRNEELRIFPNGNELKVIAKPCSKYFGDNTFDDKVYERVDIEFRSCAKLINVSSFLINRQYYFSFYNGIIVSSNLSNVCKDFNKRLQAKVHERSSELYKKLQNTL